MQPAWTIAALLPSRRKLSTRTVVASRVKRFTVKSRARMAKCAGTASFRKPREGGETDQDRRRALNLELVLVKGLIWC